MEISSIAATSIQMSMARTQQQVDLSVAKMAMDNQEAQALSLIRQMTPAKPALGQVLDTYA